MNKRKFPKVVLRTAEQMRQTASAAALKSTSSDNVIEIAPKTETSTPTIAPKASADSKVSARRRRMAIALVERYANYSAIGGAIPMPLVNATAISALMVRMVKALSDLYGIPFERNRTRAVIAALMGGALPTGFATIATSTLSYFVPGLNLLGLTVSSVTSGAYARTIGQLYIEHFESGSAPDLPSVLYR